MSYISDPSCLIPSASYQSCARNLHASKGISVSARTARHEIPREWNMETSRGKSEVPILPRCLEMKRELS